MATGSFTSSIPDATKSNTTISSTTSLGSSLNATLELDKYVRERFNSMIESYMPGWKGALSSGSQSLQTFLQTTLPTLVAGEQATYNALKRSGTQAMTGQLPADVFGQIRRTSAEGFRGEGALGGQSGSYATARDLGMSSVDLMGKGATWLNQASTVAANITNLNASAQSQLSGYTDVAKTLASVSGLSPDLMTSLTTNLAEIAQSKYNADLDAATKNRELTLNMQNAEANRRQSMQLETIGVARSAFDQQLTLAESSRTQALLNPKYASSLLDSARTMNTQIADFTNKELLRNMNTGINTRTLRS